MHSQRKSQRAVIGLKLWIFKFIRNDVDEFAVCVEGYRKKDAEERELENWRSTAVNERYNSQTLLTVSGSRYVLHGVLDQDSAYGLGYPKTLIERFRDGFPYEWRELLCDYYNNVVKPNKLHKFQGLHSSLLSSVLLDISKCSHTDGRRISTFRNAIGFCGHEVSSFSNCNAKNAKCLLIKDKILEEDEETSKNKLSASKFSDNCANSISGFTKSLGISVASSNHDSSMRKLTPKCDSQSVSAGDNKFSTDMKMTGEKEILDDKPLDNMLFKMPLLPVQRRRPKPIHLYNWTIRFSANDLGHSKLFPNFAFVIVGFRCDKNLDWKTSCILTVEGSRLLHTETGIYELIGPINTILAAQQGYPKEFVTQFLNGFPKDWYRIMSLFFNTYIEPQLPPQQSLTISEIYDDEETENLHRRSLRRSSKNNSSDGSDSDDNDSDSLSSNDSCENCREHLESTKRPTSRKSVRYRIEDSYCMKLGKRNKKHWQNKYLVPAKRVKLEEKNAVEVSPNHSLLKSRSGRTIKPRLATWTGQRIVYNIHGSPIKAIGITTDSIYSTSASDMSSSSTLHTTNLRETLLKKDRKSNFYSDNSRRFPLVAYSDSKSSSSGSDDGRLSPSTPLTPFYGKRGPHNSRVIMSSPEEDIKRKVMKRHKLCKRRTKTHKRIFPKPKNKPKKLKEKDADKKSNVEETLPIVSFSDVESEDGVVEDARTDKIVNNNIKKTKNAKKWTGNDNTRLKLAVRAICPQSEKDWENVAASMRTRTAEECRKQAMEVLKLNIAPRENKATSVSANVVDALRKTKVGTLAHQIQVDRFTRQYLKAGDGSDFFEEAMDIRPNKRKVAMMPSVITFDSDDSLLSILRTPTPKSVRRNIRRKKLIHVPDSPVCSKPKKSPIDSYVPFRFDPDDEAYRKQQLRHVHKMLKIRNQYDRNRANIAKSSFSKHYHLLLPTVQCHQNNSDEESEADEYFEDEVD
ncbi:Mis18-binding protein [Dirofilaria immitis]